jgi:hypothetical protein
MAQKLRPQAETLSGSPQPNFTNFQPGTIKAKRAPTTTDTGYDLGQFWLDKTGDDLYGLVDVSAGIATWNVLAASPGEVATLTGDTGGAISPSSGNITIAGTAGEIETSGSGSTITVGIPATFSIGSNSGTNSGTILTGSGGLTIDLANGDCIIGGGTGQFDISSDVLDNTINIGFASGACVKEINIGSPQSSSATSIQAGTGGMLLNADNGNITVTSGTGTVSISGDATANTISIGTGAGAKAITIGSTNTTSATNLTAGSGGVNCAKDFNLTAVATKITMNGGAATDFIGTGTLTNGVATILNTNIAAGDRIFVQRTAANASTALGMLITTINAGVSFVVTALETATPGDTEVNDQSSFAYFIVRQT